MAERRLLKDWTGSDRVNSISVHAERFFVRLIMKVDDHGCFYADPRLLKANLFPLLLDSIREADLTRWMAECQKSGLIVIYEIENKSYLQINDFGQRLRTKTQKFPFPIDFQESVSRLSADCQQIVSNPPPEVEEKKKKKKKEKGIADKPLTNTPIENDLFKNFQKWLNENAPNVSKMKEPFTIDQFVKLNEDFKREQIKSMCLKMHNYQPLLKKNNSANLTFRNWIKNDYNGPETGSQSTNKINDLLKAK